MEFGSIMLSPAGRIATLARVAFGIVMLCLAAPIIYTMWSSSRSRSESGEAPDLDALWKRYRRGEISWDDYLRCKVEGMQAARQDEREPFNNSGSNDVTS